MTFMFTFSFTRKEWSVTFRAGHRTDHFAIQPKLYRPSVFREPFLSVRFLCFWFTHDWNPIYTPEEAA